MLRTPKPNERLFVRNNTDSSVSFGPALTLVVRRSGGVFIDEHWGSFLTFRDDPTVRALYARGRILVEYLSTE